MIHHALWLPAHTLHLGPVRALCSKPVYTLYVWDLCLLEDLGVLASWLGPPVHTLLRLGRMHALYVWDSLCFASRFRTCSCFMVDTPLCMLYVQDPYILYGWDPLCVFQELGPPVLALRSGPVHAVWLGHACFMFKICACFMFGTPCALLLRLGPVHALWLGPPCACFIAVRTCARFMVMACACDKYLRHVHPLLRSGPVNARWQGRRRTLWLVHVRASDLRICYQFGRAGLG